MVYVYVSNTGCNFDNFCIWQENIINFIAYFTPRIKIGIKVGVKMSVDDNFVRVERYNIIFY